MPAIDKQKVAQAAAVHRAYFVSNGWPTNLDGTLTPVDKLDMAQLRALVQDYGHTLDAEFLTITPGGKRNTK